MRELATPGVERSDASAGVKTSKAAKLLMRPEAYDRSDCRWHFPEWLATASVLLVLCCGNHLASFRAVNGGHEVTKSDTQFRFVLQCIHMATCRAQPEMLDAMPVWQSAFFGRTFRKTIQSACAIVKGRRTAGICAIGNHCTSRFPLPMCSTYPSWSARDDELSIECAICSSRVSICSRM